MLMSPLKTLSQVFQPLLLHCEPETAHRIAMLGFKLLAPALKPNKPKQSHHFLGLDFPNRVGLAAGFDKNAECLLAWQNLGFGFAEVGTVTALAQAGNPKPRIFRIPEKELLLNRMGFNNDGAETIARRIEQQRTRYKIHIPIGINIGKSKVVPLEDAVRDYLVSFRTLVDLADYIVINVSSPNTPGLRQLQTRENLKPLLDAISSENSKRRNPLPLLVKLSPDESMETLCTLADLAHECQFRGLVLTNTSIDKSLAPDAERFGAGGLSGKPLFEKCTSCLQTLKQHLGDRLILVGSGGIISAEHAEAKFQAGAHLVQIYTGFIYKGLSLLESAAKLS